MKLVRIHDYGGPEALAYEDAEIPQPGPGQVLVKVAAASVNPVDWKLRSGAAKAMAPLSMPAVLGGDVSGTVAALGEGVSNWREGDEVFALLGLTGAYAQYIVTEAANLARKPGALSFAEAASLPLVALTAWQGFAEDQRDLAGLTVLIHNAAGGVGSVAVQIAKAQGARVVGTASEKNAAYVKGLGADEVFDARVTRLESLPRDIDILMDLVGNPAALELWRLVKPGGSVIRIAGGADAPAFAEQDGIRALKVRVKPNGAQLAQIGALAATGKLRPEIAASFPLAQAGAAQELSRAGHVRGKIVLTMPD